MNVLVGEAGFKVPSETSELVFISPVCNKNLNMSLETQTKLKWSSKFGWSIFIFYVKNF